MTLVQVMQARLRLWGQRGCCRNQGPCPGCERRGIGGWANHKLAGSGARLRLCKQRTGDRKYCEQNNLKTGTRLPE